MNIIILMAIAWILAVAIIALGGCLIGLVISVINPEMAFRWIQWIDNVLKFMTFGHFKIK